MPIDDSVRRLAEKIVKALEQECVPDYCAKWIEPILREVMDEARKQGAESMTMEQCNKDREEAVKDAYTRAAEVARKFGRGVFWNSDDIAAAIEALKENK